jgi:hypothetical protein
MFTRHSQDMPQSGIVGAMGNRKVSAPRLYGEGDANKTKIGEGLQ